MFCFFAETINYLNHVIRPGRLEIAKTTTKAIQELQDPTAQTEVRSFLDLCNVFRRFLPNFLQTAAPLNKKLQKGQPKSFPDLIAEGKQSVEDLKEVLMNPPMLALPRTTGHYTLHKYTCETQVVCMFLQQQPDGPVRPIDY